MHCAKSDKPVTKGQMLQDSIYMTFLGTEVTRGLGMGSYCSVGTEFLFGVIQFWRTFLVVLWLRLC